MALGTPQKLTTAVTPAYEAPLASESIAWPATNPGFLLLHVKNANAAACTVTVTSRALASDGLATSDRVVEVPLSTGDRFIRVGPAFRDADGDVAVAFSVQSSVSVAVFYP